MSLCFILWIACTLGQAQPLDRIAVLVNESVILESEISMMMDSIKQKRNIKEVDRDLKSQIIEHLILIRIQMEIANRVGLKIGDLQLDQAILQIAQNNLKGQSSLTQEQAIDFIKQQAKSQNMPYAMYREQLRTDLTIQEIQSAHMHQRIQISPQEIEGLVKFIAKEGMKTTRYHLQHILLTVPQQASAKQAEKLQAKAQKMVKDLNAGMSFKNLAMSQSDGQAALKGGDMGAMTLDEMPSLFAEAVEGKKPDDIIGPLKSGIGFHILKIVDLQSQDQLFVQEVRSRHILLKTSPILSDKKAKSMLKKFVAQSKQNSDAFGDFARKYSEDTISATQGGDLGWSDPQVYAPEFKAALEQLKIGEYSQPFKTAFGWHVVQLLERRRMNAQQKINTQKARNILYRRKFNEELQIWLNEIRNRAHVRYTLPQNIK
tara:strand:- start:2312 stop:3604 length:1293 start_codon:yes stop_codon:yes gene_type:complete